jgi:hypothetical protein
VKFGKPWILPLLLAAVLGIWVAADGRLHWDEPHYLYCGTYLSVAELVQGDVQPTGAPNDFNFGRILYILTVKALMAVAPAGVAGFALVLAFNLAMLALGVFLIGRMLGMLLPDVRQAPLATALVSMTPVMLYMAFKAMPDNQALVAAIVASYALLRCVRGARLGWCVLAAAGLTVAMLTKSQGVFLFAGFWLAVLLAAPAHIDRRGVVIFGVLSGVLALLATAVILEILGIGVMRYARAFSAAFGGGFSPLFFALYFATELGVLWLLLPVASFSARRRELLFMGLWFTISTAPFVFVFYEQVEPRHIMVNLPAAAGLFALGVEVLFTRLGSWFRVRPARGTALAALVVILLMGTNWLALALMPHEIELWNLTTMLQDLDARYGAGRYTVLSPWALSEFYTIRVVWPAVDVRSVELMVEDEKPEREPLRELRDIHYHGLNIESLEELSKVHRPLVYLGMQPQFGAGVFDLLARIAPRTAAKLTKWFPPADQLYSAGARWLWASPRAQLQPLARVGPYRAFLVQLRPPGPGYSPPDYKNPGIIVKP